MVGHDAALAIGNVGEWHEGRTGVERVVLLRGVADRVDRLIARAIEPVNADAAAFADRETRSPRE